MTNVSRSNTALIVTDDLMFGHSVAEGLRHSNLFADVFRDLAHALSKCAGQIPDLIILNRSGGGESPVNDLVDLRAKGDFPIIIIGHDGDDADVKIACLENGADDYLKAPFDIRELAARIEIISRRNRDSQIDIPRKPPSGKWLFGGWELRLRSRQLRDPTGALVPLTNGEYSLLVAFLEAAQKPLTREQLLQATRIHEDIVDRSIDVQILRLRRKLEEDARSPELIKTARGVGYVLNTPAERA